MKVKVNLEQLRGINPTLHQKLLDFTSRER